MAEIQIPNVRQESTVLLHTKLNDNQVQVNWNSLSNIKAYMYSDAQKVIAGKCDVVIASRFTLDVTYPATRPQYLGVNSLLIRCTYQGRQKTFDLPVVNFVERSAEADGVTVLDDPEMDVTLEVDEVSTSLLDGAIAAALDAAVQAEDAAAHLPIIVDGYWALWDASEQQYVKTDTQAQGPEGAAIKILGTLSDPSELPASGNEVGDAYIIDGDLWSWTAAGAWNNNGRIQGPKGDKGDPGPANLFIARYGETPFSEIVEAMYASKVIYCDYDYGYLLPLVDYNVDLSGNPVRFMFQGVQFGANIGTITAYAEATRWYDALDSLAPIENTVNDLVNYYLKSETYSRSEVQQLIAAIQGVSFVSVQTLPTASADTMGGKIYLVPSTNPDTQNVKDEFITIQDGSTYAWEQIGSTAIDLSGYVTIQQLNTALAAYTTTEALTTLLAAKQDTISDLSSIRSGAAAGATAYQKPQTGIPASDLASGVIPTVPTDIVKYSSQTLTEAQQTQARTNIGAAAASALTALETAIAAKYTKPSSGIPETDLASGVQSALALARTSIQSLADYYDKTQIDSLLAAVSSEQYVDVATLPAASASTLGKIYLVGPTDGVYDRYYTSYDGTTYSWVGVGTTEINLANYATKAELNQLSQTVTDLDDVVNGASGERRIVSYDRAEAVPYNLNAHTAFIYNANYESIFIPILPGHSYIATGGSYFAVLAAKPDTTITTSQNAVFASGYSDRIAMETGVEYPFIAPANAAYVYFYLGSKSPILYEVVNVVGLVERVEKLEEQPIIETSFKKFDLIGGSLSASSGMYPTSLTYFIGYSHTPKFIRRHGTIKVLTRGIYGRVIFYTSEQEVITSTTFDTISADYELVFPENAELFRLSIFKTNNSGLMPKSILLSGAWNGDDDEYQSRPNDSGYQNVTAVVKIDSNNVPSITQSELSVPIELSTDSGVLHLPESYSKNGEPTPLIIFLHGSADKYTVSSKRFSAGTPYAPEWDAAGYAQLDVDAITDKYNQGVTNPSGSGNDYECILAAYEWVIAHFNIRRDGIYLFGRSRGAQAVLTILGKYDPTKLPIVCAICNSGANTLIDYILYSTGSSDKWTLFCDSHGLPSDGRPAYTSGSFVQDAAIVQFLRDNINIWWTKAMSGLWMITDNPTQYNTPATIFDLLVSSYNATDVGKDYCDFIRDCKFKSPVPLRFDWCKQDTIQDWDADTWGNYSSALKDAFIGTMNGNAVYREWPTSPANPSRDPHFHELLNFYNGDVTLLNGQIITDPSMARTEWLFWAQLNDARYDGSSQVVTT